MIDDARVSEVSRRLRSRCDAIMGAIWFAPEGGDGFPHLAARAACLGRVRGDVAAALLAPISSRSTAAEIDDALRDADPDSLLARRLEIATGYLATVLGGERPPGVERAVTILRPAVEAAPVEGHPLFAGLRSLPWPGTPLGDLWRACDMVRERRGDSHRSAWQSAGLAAVDIQLLTERWRTRPNPGSTTATSMGFAPGEIDAALEGLRARGWLDDDGGLTDEGRAVRDGIELATDRQERPLVEALGDDVDELFDLLAPWARAVVGSAA